MTNRLRKHLLLGTITVLLVGGVNPIPAQSLGLRGQASAWMVANLERLDESQTGLRYIPAVSAMLPLSQSWNIDGELSLNGYGTGRFDGWQHFQTEGEIKPYRAWLRVSSNRFEARVGLQKINFGSATLLRPLMWFDRIDPRDPLQLTDGVWGLLFRYYFLNNANIWVWGLYGNDEPKGWDIVPSEKDRVEFGGRVQWPLFTGEMALTYHHRQADYSEWPLSPGSESVPEDRIAIDGKWDIVVGFWFETVLVRQDVSVAPFQYQRLINLGLDYTFSIGNGVNAMGEHLIMETAEEPFAAGERISFSALSLNYPLGLLDILMGMVFYDWENHDWYRFINWQRTYDNWSFYLMAFWNPDQFQLYQTVAGNNLFAGKGFQFMVVFNH